MIRVHKIMTDNRDSRNKRIEDLVEEFLSKKNIELVDVKYQVTPYKIGYNTIYKTSALIIYKEINDDD